MSLTFDIRRLSDDAVTVTVRPDGEPHRAPERSERVMKTVEERRIAYGEVYIPGVLDSHGDFMTVEDVLQAAHQFARDNLLGEVDVQHDGKTTSCHIVETFIAREGDPDFLADAWVIGMHVPSDKLWGAIKRGELNGFSMEALARREDAEITLNIPESVTGHTTTEHGHFHVFHARYNPDGSFAGGYTEEAAGHTHDIYSTTVTQPAGDDGHTHRFAAMDLLAQSNRRV